MTDARSWRRMEAPPAGGIARLQAAIESGRRGSRSSSLAHGAWVGAVAAVIVVALAVTAGYREQRARRAFADSLQAALLGAQVESIREHGISRDLPSGRTDVRIVVLAPRDGADRTPSRQ